MAYERKTPLSLECGLHLFREILNGKWKFSLIYYISTGFRRPGELQRKIPLASRRVLDVQLKELTEHKLIVKTIHPVSPPNVEYHLTELGKALLPVIRTMGSWAEEHREELESVIGDQQ